jgi:hypothetical protein
MKGKDKEEEVFVRKEETAQHTHIHVTHKVSEVELVEDVCRRFINIIIFSV